MPLLLPTQFLNTKSGPQVGASLKRRFLKLLNPLQVVMLPAEKPEPALRLFRGKLLPNTMLDPQATLCAHRHAP